MENIEGFYTLLDRVGSLLGQEMLPILHISDPVVREDIGETKATFALVRDNVPVSLLSDLDKGPGKPIESGDIPHENRAVFQEWLNKQSLAKQIFFYLGAMSQAADNKMSFIQKDTLGNEAEEPFKSTKCYAIIYDFNWSEDTGFVEPTE